MNTLEKIPKATTNCVLNTTLHQHILNMHHSRDK